MFQIKSPKQRSSPFRASKGKDALLKTRGAVLTFSDERRVPRAGGLSVFTTKILLLCVIFAVRLPYSLSWILQDPTFLSIARVHK